MENNSIRTLLADEIECRVQSVKKQSNGCILLLYKDARCDMRILDEVFGIKGWQRSHELINENLFCTVEIWDEEKKLWIKKQDVGTESNTEKEKGQASDAFKRACFNIGIGRELYTAPFIWISLDQSEFNGEKLSASIKFHVKEIRCNEKKEINKLIIVDQKGNTRFELGRKIASTQTQLIQQVNEADLAIALDEIKNCKTTQELTSLWNHWKGLQISVEFCSAMSAKKSEILIPKNQ